MSRYMNSIFFLVVTFLVVAFFWLKFTMVNEIIRADGAIEPEGKVQTVQSRFQSVIKEINVEVGDKILKGTILVKLNDEESKSQLEENLSTLKSINAEIIRLTAEVSSEEGINWPQSVSQQLQISQENLYISKRQSMSQQVMVLSEGTKLFESKIADIKQQIEGIRRLRTLKLEEKNIYLSLIEVGAEPKIRLINVNQEIQKLDNEIGVLTNNISELTINSSQNEEKKKEIMSNYKTMSYEDLATKENEREIIKTKTNALKERVSASYLISPVDGFITKVMPSGPGAIVNSGESIIEIVPISSSVLIKANLSPQNINNVRIGQHARVNLLSYDFTKYGSLSGVVRSIPKNTTTNENGDVFYNILVECKSTMLSKSDINPAIIPGMLVQVEITGEERSVLDYLLQPIRESGSKAFTENG